MHCLTNGASIGLASARDLSRRPAFGVGVVALGAMLALLPRLGNPAAGIGDNRALAIELTLSTLGLVAPLVAGCLAAWGLQRDHDAGLGLELASSGDGVAGAVVGRCLGAVLVTVLALVAAVAIGAVGWLGVPGEGHTPGPTAVTAAVFGLLAGVATGAGIGALWGAVGTGEVAFVMVVVHLAVARGLAGVGGASVLVPDPTRLEFAREVAFGHAVSPTGALLGCVAAGVQTAAMLCASVWLCRRRIASGAS